MMALTRDEQQNVRYVLRYLHAQSGTWKPLEKAFGYQHESLGKVASGRSAVTIALAFRVARFLKVNMEELIAGKHFPENACPHCGRELDRAPTADASCPVATRRTVR